MTTVVLVSAVAEWQALGKLIPNIEYLTSPYGQCFTHSIDHEPVIFFHSGWGKIASAASMQYVIDRWRPELTVNLGTCGGFDGMVGQGEIILVEKTFIYDIVELMGDFGVVENFFNTELDLSWLRQPFPYPVRRGTLASADGDLIPEKISHLMQRGAIAADWESGALAWVAHKNRQRLLILRGVSDLVHETGGEAYGNIELFKERTVGVMDTLLKQLPGWVGAAGSNK